MSLHRLSCCEHIFLRAGWTIVPSQPRIARANVDAKRFGRYVLLERLAVGGMAEVFLAKAGGAAGFERLIAIKRILPQMCEDQEFISMFIDEAKIAGRLTHASIAPILELGKVGSTYYIAMEFVWGRDVLQVINRFRRLRQKMPAPMAAFVAAKVCEGLDYAHNRKDENGNLIGLIHRDVSPQNILISYEGEVKIIDFGIAKAAARNTRTQAGVLKGKFGYMSPEQVAGAVIDGRSDVFALGTCLYEMLVADRLFLGDSDFATLERVRNAAIPPLRERVPSVPVELERIVLRALAKDPGDRYQSAREFETDLMRFLASTTPPYSSAFVADWMKIGFHTEFEREQEHFEYLMTADLLPSEDVSSLPSEPSGRIRKDDILHSAQTKAKAPAAARSIPADDFDRESDPTMVTPFEELHETSTHVFFTSPSIATGTGASLDGPTTTDSLSPTGVRRPAVPVQSGVEPQQPQPSRVPAIVRFIVIVLAIASVSFVGLWVWSLWRRQLMESNERADVAPTPSLTQRTPPAPLAPPPVPSPVVVPTAPAIPVVVSPPPAASPPVPAKRPDPPRTPVTESMGTLQINTTPWSHVFLDGRDTHLDTPVLGLRVKAGRHTVTLRTQAGQSETVHVEIEANKTVRVIRDLSNP